MLFSDFQQLILLKGFALFVSLNKLKKPKEIARYNAQYAFDRTIELTKIKRQEGANLAFLDILAALRNSNNYITYQYQQTLVKRASPKLPIAKVTDFDSTIRIYSRKAKVNLLNYDAIARLKQLTKLLKAVY